MASIKMSPASNTDTLAVIKMLSNRDFSTIVDAGCGKGRQTLVLAAELNSVINAIDIQPEYLAILESEARKAGLSDRITLHNADISDISSHFSSVDLLWAEASAYCIGFEYALRKWRQIIRPKSGYLVVSELSIIQDNVSNEAKEHLSKIYPQISHREDNIVKCHDAGYRISDVYTVPKESWMEDYYDDMSVMALKLITHSEPGVRKFAEQTLNAINLFQKHHEYFSYVFYILKTR